MNMPTNELVGRLQVFGSALDSASEDGLCGIVTQAASRLQELDNEVTQLRLQLEKFARKAKKTGTGGVG